MFRASALVHLIYLRHLTYNTSDNYNFTYIELVNWNWLNSGFNNLTNTKPSVHPYKFFTIFHSTIVRQKLKLKTKERTENFIDKIPKNKRFISQDYRYRTNQSHLVRQRLSVRPWGWHDHGGRWGPWKNYETEYNLLKIILAALTLFSCTTEEAMCSYKKNVQTKCDVLLFAFCLHYAHSLGSLEATKMTWNHISYKLI